MPSGPYPEYMPLATKLVSAVAACAPPTASRYLSRIWSTVGPPGRAGGTSTSSSSGGGAPYRRFRLDVTSGFPVLPRWHVKQVTTCLPPKFSSLIAAIIRTMRRAVSLKGVSFA